MFGQAMRGMMGAGKAAGAMGMGRGSGGNAFGKQMQPQQQQMAPTGPQGSQGMGGAVNAITMARNRMQQQGKSFPGFNKGPNQNYQQMYRPTPMSPTNIPVNQPTQRMQESNPEPIPAGVDPYMYDPGNGMPKTPYIPFMQPQSGGLEGGYGGLGPRMPRIIPDPEFENVYAQFRGQGMEFPQAMDATQAQLGQRNPMDQIRRMMQPESRGIGPSSPYEQLLQPKFGVQDFAGQPNQYGMRPV